MNDEIQNEIIKKTWSILFITKKMAQISVFETAEMQKSQSWASLWTPLVLRCFYVANFL